MRGAGEDSCADAEECASTRDSAGASAEDLVLRTVRFLTADSGEPCSGVKSGEVSDMKKKVKLQKAFPERQRR